MKKGVGRPSEFNDEVVKKLEEAFSMDCSVAEACLLANISRPTYYNNVKEGSKLFIRFEELRNHPVLKARKTVYDKLGESFQNAMEYLKRKNKLEFGDNIDLTSKGEKLNALVEIQKNTKDILNRE